MIPDGFCQCGCGRRTSLVMNKTRPDYGQYARWTIGHHMKAKADKSRNGYVPLRDSTRKHRYVYEHALKAEAALGRPLPKGAQVHHVDENKRNNANTNLVICQDAAYHRLLHVRAKIVRAGGNPNTQQLCSWCNTVKDLTEFCKNPLNKRTGRNWVCKSCKNAYQQAAKKAQAA